MIKANLEAVLLKAEHNAFNGQTYFKARIQSSANIADIIIFSVAKEIGNEILSLPVGKTYMFDVVVSSDNTFKPRVQIVAVKPKTDK